MRKRYANLNSFHFFFLYYAIHKYGADTTEMHDFMFYEAYASFCYLGYQSGIHKNRLASEILQKFSTPIQLHNFGLWIRHNIEFKKEGVKAYYGKILICEGNLMTSLAHIIAENHHRLPNFAECDISAGEGRSNHEGKVSKDKENKNIEMLAAVIDHPITKALAYTVLCAMAATAVYAIYTALTSKAGLSQWRQEEAASWRELLAFGEKVASRRP